MTIIIATVLASGRLSFAVTRLPLSSATLRLAALFALFTITRFLPIFRARLSSGSTAWLLVTPRLRSLRSSVGWLRNRRVSALAAIGTGSGVGSGLSAIFIGRVLLFVSHFVRKAEA